MAPPPAVPQEAACSAEPSSWQRLACACHPQLQPGRARRHGLPGQHLYTLYVHAPPWPDFKGARRATARHLPFASCCERDVELRAAACPHTPTLAASPRAVTSSRVWWAHHGCLPPQYPPPPARPPPATCSHVIPRPRFVLISDSGLPLAADAAADAAAAALSEPRPLPPRPRFVLISDSGLPLYDPLTLYQQARRGQGRRWSAGLGGAVRA